MTANTSGHSSHSGGLRGHSIDHDTYPWRVVAGHWRRADGSLGHRWMVYAPNGEQAAEFCDAGGIHEDDIIKLAHDYARQCKAAYGWG